MKNHFTITMPAKHYIRKYLEINCGVPVNLSVFPDLFHDFRQRLTKDPGPEKPRFNIADPETVTIIISDADFYRKGFEMSEGDIKEFTKLVEMRIKYLSRLYITNSTSTGMTLTLAIQTFQEDYGLPEEVWAFESIKKDYFRNVGKSKKSILKSLKKEMHQFLCGEMI